VIAQRGEFFHVRRYRAVLDPAIEQPMNLEVRVTANGGSEVAVVLESEGVVLVLMGE
jgi:hypothetical protein